MGEEERNQDVSTPPAPRAESHTDREVVDGASEESSPAGGAAVAKGRTFGGAPTEDLDASDRALLSAGELPWALRIVVFLAPLGLLIVVVTSLWILQLGVQRSVVIQVAPQLVPDQEFALRAQLLDGSLSAKTEVEIDVALLQGGARTEIGSLEAVGNSGVHQATLVLPDKEHGVSTGPAQLEVVLREPGRGVVRESVDITIVDAPAGRAGVRVNSSSTLNYADDTSEHPKEVRVDLRPFSRTLAGFENEMLVRTSLPDGSPISCDVEVWLVDGEWDGHAVVQGGKGEPIKVAGGKTDTFGILRFRGTLTSLLVRFDVRVSLPAPAETAAMPSALNPAGPPAPAMPSALNPAVAPLSPAAPPADPTTNQAAEGQPGAVGTATPPAALLRNIRLVTFSGGVDLSAAPLLLQSGDEVELTAHTLRGKRPVFIDGHGPGGIWISTARPQLGTAIVEKSKIPSGITGMVQYEAYNFTNRPGEDTAVARVIVMDDEGSPSERRRRALLQVIKLQRDALDTPRVEKHFDRAQEKIWLDKLQARLSAPQLDLGGEAVDSELLERWLIGTLPIDIYGPPLGLSTRAREEEAVVARRVDLTLAVRAFTMVGSALLIAMSVFAMWRENAQFMTRMRDVLGDEAELVSARQQQMMRGTLVIATLVVSIVVGLALLENLVWIH